MRYIDGVLETTGKVMGNAYRSARNFAKEKSVYLLLAGLSFFPLAEGCRSYQTNNPEQQRTAMNPVDLDTDDNTDGMVDRRVITRNEHDSDGNLIQRWEFDDNADGVVDSRNIIRYDSDGNRIR